MGRTSDDETIDRVSCNLAVPVEVASGYTLGIFKVEYRGYTNVPSDDGYSEFFAEYFFAGIKGSEYEQRYIESGDVYISNDVGVVVWSSCGANTNLRVNTAIIAHKEEDHDPD